jgi:hypothetical protein
VPSRSDGLPIVALWCDDLLSNAVPGHFVVQAVRAAAEAQSAMQNVHLNT